ncbi:MAG TPA: hypothetical protein VGO43_12260 [Pyrinomonadaceae bacterium]|nr:hypothetical protein [Pyrinomonadaceae bacterium]
MLNTVKFNFLAWRPMFILGGLLFAAFCALLPTSAHGQCAQWDASGEWQIQQSNGYTLSVDLTQSGKAINGTSSYGTTTGGTKVLGVLVVGGDPAIHRDNVSGNIEGDDFYVLIGTAGVYRGKVGPSGRIDGTTYDQNHPSSQATWFSSRTMKCSPPPPPPRPKPIKSSGKAKVESAPTPPSTPAPPMKVPGIVASQVIFTSIYQPVGFVVLTWDAGPDHPNAQVWVKINGSPKILVLKQPKGGLQQTVERGRTYEYILAEKTGKTLSTVMVVAVN